MLLLTGSSFSVWAETTITDVLPKGTTTIFNAKYQHGVRGEGDVWASDPADDGNGKHWYDKDFDDSSWESKKVPFGSDLSGDQKWEGEYNCYWLRINFNLDAVDNTATYYFLCRHDDTYKAYINGNLIADRNGWTGDGYCYVPINNSQLSTGTNVIAVYIQQNNGGSYFDCGVQKYNYQQSDFDTRFKGVEVSNGEYYLYNPASRLWLQNNDRIRSDWNTRAELGTRGLDFTLTQQGNGGYYLQGKFNAASCPSIQAANRYLDTNSEDAWHFEKVNVPGLTNAYKVTYWPTDQNDFTLTGSSQSPTPSTNLFTPTVSNNIFLDCWRTDINDYSVWVLVTKEQRMAMMMSATSSAPQDATWLIKNADLADVDDRASAWEKTGSFTYNARNNDDNTRFGRVYESYNTENIEFSQTISNLPAGKYRMRVQGFYRSGEAKMFAGSSEQAMLSSDTQDDIWTVARNMYYNGAYIGDWMEFTHNGGDLKLGIKKGAKAGDTDWVVFSKFALEYLSMVPKANDGNYTGSGLYSYLFDGDTNTKWEAWPNWASGGHYGFNKDNGNVLFETSEPVYVNGLTLYTGADTQSYPGRNPYEWYLYGTNDPNIAFDKSENSIALADETLTGSGWTLIEYVNNAQMPAENAVGKYYKFNPSQTPYKYFRFYVHKLVGEDELQLSELVLDYSTTAKAPITCVGDGGNYGSEVAANLFDGPSTTKWCKGNNASTNWVVFKTARPIYASSYIIQTANDADGRDPKTFKLYGALDAAPTTDGSTEGWTEIDSEDDASGAIPTDRYAFADFTIDNPGLYQYFMFKAEANRNNDASFQMSELIIDNDPAYAIITSDADMAEFANKVNSGSTSLNAFLFADVNSSTSAGTTDNKYVGTFDGQGHVVTLNISTSTEYQGLIGCATGGAVIQNVITRGSVNGSARCGGILGGSQGSGAISITNCGNEANITVTNQNAGGVHGCNNGSGVVYTLTNCYNTGTIYGGSESAGLSGWLGNNATVINCYNSGSVTGIDNSNRSFARWNTGTYENCYNTLPAGTFSGRTDDYPMSKVTSGELCYRLNGDTNDGTTWTQTIGTDGHPIPFSTRQAVHQANTNCFTNLPVSDHVVQINNADDLVKFSAEVNNGNISMDADVVADIDMTDKSDWWPIGGTDASDNENDDAKAYKGTFDGKNHTIDNLVQDANGNNNQGLFGVVNGGCVIKNLILGSGCHFKGAKFVGALVGSSRGSGWVTIQNCGNEGTVTASGNNAAAIIGCVINGGPATRITDCYNRGNVSGNAESAILTGWFGGHSSVEVNNFYNTGTISGHDGGHLYRNNANIIFNNVYHTSANQNATQIGEGWLTSGELCYKLGAAFTQDLSQEGYPTFGSKAVSAGKWFNDATDDVYYNFKDGNYTVYQLNLSDQISKYSVPENVTAKNVSISRTIPEGQWIGLCLPFDYDIPSGWEVRELQSVNGSGESARMLFSTATSIVAGKPYIVKPTSEVETIVATDKAIATAAGTIVEGDITMIGNFASETLTPGTYYINKSSQLMKLGDGYTANLKGFRVYFTVDGSSPVKALGFDFEDNATGVEDLNLDVNLNETIYNIAGQRLNKTQKGINIINGKKVLK